MTNKELKFEINGKTLTVADMDWYIDGIDYIYVDRDTSAINREYSIFIKTNMDLVKLYYKNEYFDDCFSQFEKLCTAINKVKPSFNKIPGNPTFLDFSKVEKIKVSKPIKDKLIFTLKNSEEKLVVPINFECAKERYKSPIELLKESRIAKNDCIL